MVATVETTLTGDTGGLVMKKFLLGSVGLAAMIAGPAMAADMPLKAPPPVAIFSWTGCYVGAHVGGKSARSELIMAPTPWHLRRARRSATRSI
jgi:hypothetical protein